MDSIYVVERPGSEQPFIGPFDSFDAADKWAARHDGDATEKPGDFDRSALTSPDDVSS